MKVPDLERLGRTLAGIGLFVSGAIVGSAVYMSLHQTNFSILVERNAVLADENENLRAEIQNLNKFKSSQSIVKKITVRLENDPKTPIDPLVAQELRKQVQKKLVPLYEGHSLALFTSGTEEQQLSEIRKVREIVTERYTALEHGYDVEATGLAVVQTELVVFIRARPVTVSESALFH